MKYLSLLLFVWAFPTPTFVDAQARSEAPGPILRLKAQEWIEHPVLIFKREAGVIHFWGQEAPFCLPYFRLTPSDPFGVWAWKKPDASWAQDDFRFYIDELACSKVPRTLSRAELHYLGNLIAVEQPVAVATTAREFIWSPPLKKTAPSQKPKSMDPQGFLMKLATETEEIQSEKVDVGVAVAGQNSYFFTVLDFVNLKNPLQALELPMMRQLEELLARLVIEKSGVLKLKNNHPVFLRYHADLEKDYQSDELEQIVIQMQPQLRPVLVSYATHGVPPGTFQILTAAEGVNAFHKDQFERQKGGQWHDAVKRFQKDVVFEMLSSEGSARSKKRSRVKWKDGEWAILKVTPSQTQLSLILTLPRSNYLYRKTFVISEPRVHGIKGVTSVGARGRTSDVKPEDALQPVFLKPGLNQWNGFTIEVTP